jgi:4-amino-4-deoxy-L-arabinose transferase-like glycosyltransferase
MRNKSLLSLLLIVSVASFISFFYLGNLPLLDPDEPVYAETAREMIQFHDFISPRIYHDFWYDKPPMYYWLVAGAFTIFGDGEFGARVPSALLGVAGTLLIYFAGRDLFNKRAGILAALVLTTSLEYFYLSKAAVTDITLTFFMTAALLAFIRKQYYLFYGCAALAVLTKGPIGIIIPAGIIILYLLATRDIAELKKVKLISGSMLFLVIALPWYAVMYHYHGWDFLNTFLGFHNITRFLEPEHPDGILCYYYVPVLIFGFFPWSAFIVQALYAAIKQGYKENHKNLLFLTIWAAVVFLFFSASQTKLISYILPMYPALALITGWYIDKIWLAEDQKAFLLSARILTILIILLEGTLFYAAQKVVPAALLGVQLSGAIFMLLLVMIWWMDVRGNYRKAITAKVFGMVVFFVILMTSVLPAAAPSLSMREFSGQFIKQYDGQTPVYIAKFYRPGFMFYAGMPGRELQSTDQLIEVMQRKQRTYFIIKKKEYGRLPLESKAQLIVVNELEDKVLLLQEKSNSKN